MSRWTARRWLAAFRDAGGFAWFPREGDLRIGQRLHGVPRSAQLYANAMIRELETEPLRIEAVALQVAWSG